MNLIQKLAKKVKDTIDEALLKHKLNIFVDKETLECESMILDLKEEIECYIEQNNFDSAFNNYNHLQNAYRRKERLQKFREYVLNEKYDEDR